MKKFRYLCSLLLAVCLVTACEKDKTAEEGPYVDNSYGVYFPSSQADNLAVSTASGVATYALNLDPAADTEVTFTAKRTKTDGAITVPYTLHGEVFAAEAITFADGADETTFTVSFPNAAVGTNYTGIIEIDDPLYASQLTTEATTLRFSVIRESWKSLGLAKFAETWYFDDVYEAELLQNESNPNQFRLMDPYTEGLLAEDYVDTPNPNASAYLAFRILQPGEKVYDTTVTVGNLVYFDPIRPGWIHPNYGAYVDVYHPSAFTNFSTEDSWSHNKVLSYQDNGLPAIVQLAPYYYMSGVGGWNYTTYDGVVTITFPGAADFSFELANNEPENGRIVIYPTVWGNDINRVKYAFETGAVPERRVQTIAEAIASGETAAAGMLTDPEQAILASFDETGMYTIVCALLDKNNELLGSAALTFGYVAAGDEVPVVADVQIVKATEDEITFYFAGEDLTEVVYGAFETSKLSGMTYADIVDQLKGNDDEEIEAVGTALTSAQLAAVNNGGALFKIDELNAGLSYTVVVYAFNGYVSNLFADRVMMQGDALPLFRSWSVNDLYEIEKEDLFKTWTMWARDYYDEDGITDRQPMSYVTFSENDIDDDWDNDSDAINVKGLGLGELDGDDTTVWEWYEGVIYNLAPKGALGTYANGTYTIGMLITDLSAGSLYNASSYMLIGGIVDEGYMALVSANPNYHFDGICLRAYADAAMTQSAGNLEMYYDIMFEDPAVSALSAKSAVKKASFSKPQLNALASSLHVRDNYVETDRGLVHRKIDELRASQQPATLKYGSKAPAMPSELRQSVRPAAAGARNSSAPEKVSLR